MLRIGYLTAMAPAEALDEEVDKLATILAGNAPVAMRGMKRAINEFARGELDEEAADQRAIATACAAPRSRKASRRSRKSVRRGFEDAVEFLTTFSSRSGVLRLVSKDGDVLVLRDGA